MDTFDSGLGISARARAELTDRITVIPALDFSSPALLLDELERRNFTSILFSWRFLLNDLLKSKCVYKKMNSLARQASIGFLVADHLGEEHEFHKKERFMADNVDYFLVTSRLLSNFYSESTISSKLAGMFHDIPNLSLISDVRGMSLSKNETITWIGNSVWGKRQSKHDHKGLNQLVVPLSNELTSINHPVSVQIIDSSKSRLTNREVLIKIAESRFIIIASQTEGTALPILEAIALGTFPISTHVGVAPELLNGEFEDLICSPHVEDFLDTLHRYENRDFPVELKNSFENYISNALIEKIPTIRGEGDILNRDLNSIKADVYFWIRWKLRFHIQLWKLKLKH